MRTDISQVYTQAGFPFHRGTTAVFVSVFAAVLLLLPGQARAQAPCGGSVAVGSATNTDLVADCNALLAAKDALEGSGTLNWSTAVAIAQWEGVTVSEGRVTELDLSQKSLSGKLPALGDLTHLWRLDVSGNQLTSLPKAVGNLTNLEYLLLSDNQLTSIPRELGKLTNLEALHLDDNQLTSVPKAVGKLTKLWALTFRGNQLTSVPKELGNLTNLVYLHLNDNKLTRIPKELGNLTNLRYLGLSNNQLKRIPGKKQLKDLRDRGGLDVEGNPLSSKDQKWADN